MFGAEFGIAVCWARHAGQTPRIDHTRVDSDGCVDRRSLACGPPSCAAWADGARYGPAMFDSISDSAFWSTSVEVIAGLVVAIVFADVATTESPREQVRWYGSLRWAAVHCDRRRTGSVPGCARRCAAAEDLGGGGCVGFGRQFLAALSAIDSPGFTDRLVGGYATGCDTVTPWCERSLPDSEDHAINALMHRGADPVVRCCSCPLRRWAEDS